MIELTVGYKKTCISYAGENTELYLVVITRCVKVCVLLSTNVYKIQEVDIISLHNARPSGYRTQVFCNNILILYLF